MERLELLGDSVLKYVVSCHLFLKFPKKDEGQLTSSRVDIISNAALYGFGIEHKIQVNCISFWVIYTNVGFVKLTVNIITDLPCNWWHVIHRVIYVMLHLILVDGLHQDSSPFILFLVIAE